MSSGLSLLLDFPIMHFPQNIFFNNNNERNYLLKWEPESKRKIVLTILTFSFKIKNFSNIDVWISMNQMIHFVALYNRAYIAIEYLI